MSTNRMSKLKFAALGVCALGSAHVAQAQYYDAPIKQVDPNTLPADMRVAPTTTDRTETILGPDGVETIIRTRVIDNRAPVSAYARGYENGYPAGPVIERDQWIDECRARTRGVREDEKARTIGGLLGAVAGGVIGNRVAGDGNRLGGTLLGAGAGGLGGVLLGDLIGGGKRDGVYDCEAALDGYVSQYGYGPGRTAYRSIPANGSAHGYGYPQYGHSGSYGCNCNQGQGVSYVAIRQQEPQRVVVRETVRDEFYEVPGAARIIEDRYPAPLPSPKMIKTQPSGSP